MPTTPTLPARLKASHIFNYLKKLDSAKQIIACPRNERPHLNEKSGSNMVKLPEINPARYAPRQPFIAVAIPVANTSTRGSGGAITSGSSSGNSIEKRQRLPVMNKRFVTKKTQENGIANTETTKNYISKSYSTKNRRPAPTRTNRIPRVTSAKASGTSSTEPNTSSNSAASSSKKDSGTGTSINSQQSERSMSMTEQKAKMIRDELRASLRQHLKQNSSSDQYSEEDMIREEESDYEQIGGGIHSGTSEEEEEEEEEHKRLKKRKKPSRGSSDRSNRTPSLRTPSTAASGRLSNGSTASKDRLETLSRQDTPFQETPSRKSSLASNRTHSGPKSNYSSRESTSSRAVLEPSDDEDENMEDEGSHEREDVLQVREDSEDEMAEDASRETPAIHTPDTRLSSAKSRKSTASSDENSRINSSSSSVAWSRISGSDKEMILPSDEEEDQYRDIGTAERERLGEAATKIQVAFKKYNSRRKRVQFEKERMEYEQRFQKYKIEILIGERYGVEFDTPLFIVLHGENGSSEKLYSQQKSWLFCDVDLSDKLLEIDLNEGRQIINSRMGIHMSRTTANLGQLTSIDIGHEREGYGAGTFIDRVFITEEGNTKGRRFYFQVEKWFDSEQIDGLIERSIPLSSFLYLEPSIINRKESSEFHVV
uniref:PLAT domain-containing protein n=1 Tax=Caenorhabditis tropicalis TaxID=1561998 RepID=A0A1I7UY23_9PELO